MGAEWNTGHFSQTLTDISTASYGRPLKTAVAARKEMLNQAKKMCEPHDNSGGETESH